MEFFDTGEGAATKTANAANERRSKERPWKKEEEGVKPAAEKKVGKKFFTFIFMFMVEAKK